MVEQKKELVSVIIPTYKRSDTLKRAIDSVLNQTYPNIEIIIVDDNANFLKTRDCNRELVKKYENIVFVENERNLGGGLSRNEGIQTAHGDFIAFLDDDDEYMPTKIEKQMQIFSSSENSKLAVVYCYANMINVNGSKYIYAKDIDGCPLLQNIENCIAPTSFWLCKKTAIEDVGCFEDISSRQDASLLTKLFLNGYEISRVPEALLNYYWHDAAHGISKNSFKTVEAEKQYREMFLKLSKNVDNKTRNEALYCYSFRIAREYTIIGERKKAYNELGNMLRHHIFDTKVYRIFATTFFNYTYRYCAGRKNRKRVGE